MSNKILFTLFFFSLYLYTAAQNTLRPSVYFQDMNYYNPASIILDTGQRASVSLYGKHKFVSNDEEIWHKPTSLYLNHTGRIKESNAFYTLSYINDRYSFFNRHTIYAGYTRQKKWGRSNTLSFAGRLVLNADAINWNKLKLRDNQSGKSVKITPDLDLGIQYQSRGFTAGIAAKNLLSYTVKTEEKSIIKNWREFYINVSYRFTIRKNFQLAPYLLLYRERKTFADAGVFVSAWHRVNASYLLRINELRSIYTFDVTIYKGFNAGLAFDKSALLPDHNLDFVLRYTW